MLNDLLLYAGSALIIVWGIAHIVPTQPVVAGFGSLSVDNKRILTMEWIENLPVDTAATPVAAQLSAPVFSLLGGTQ